MLTTLVLHINHVKANDPVTLVLLLLQLKSQNTNTKGHMVKRMGLLISNKTFIRKLPLVVLHFNIKNL